MKQIKNLLRFFFSITLITTSILGMELSSEEHTQLQREQLQQEFLDRGQSYSDECFLEGDQKFQEVYQAVIDCFNEVGMDQKSWVQLKRLLIGNNSSLLLKKLLITLDINEEAIEAFYNSDLLEQLLNYNGLNQNSLTDMTSFLMTSLNDHTMLKFLSENFEVQQIKFFLKEFFNTLRINPMFIEKLNKEELDPEHIILSLQSLLASSKPETLFLFLIKCFLESIVFDSSFITDFLPQNTKSPDEKQNKSLNKSKSDIYKTIFQTPPSLKELASEIVLQHYLLSDIKNLTSKPGASLLNQDIIEFLEHLNIVHTRVVSSSFLPELKTGISALKSLVNCSSQLANLLYRLINKLSIDQFYKIFAYYSVQELNDAPHISNINNQLLNILHKIVSIEHHAKKTLKNKNVDHTPLQQNTYIAKWARLRNNEELIALLEKGQLNVVDQKGSSSVQVNTRNNLYNRIFLLKVMGAFILTSIAAYFFTYSV